MRSVRRSVGAALVVSGLFPLTAFAQNGPALTAASIAIGQAPVRDPLTLGSGAEARWYVFGYVVAGRSYCATTGLSSSFAYQSADTHLTVYRFDGTTIIGENGDASATEPGTLLSSRVCWIAPLNNSYSYAKVTWFLLNNPPTVRYGTLSVVETTLWCPWFFIAGDYNAFTLLRNTTNTAVNVIVTWRDLAGAAVGTYSGAHSLATATLRSTPGRM